MWDAIIHYMLYVLCRIWGKKKKKKFHSACGKMWKHVPQLSAGVLTSGIKVCKQICNMVSKNWYKIKLNGGKKRLKLSLVRTMNTYKLWLTCPYIYSLVPARPLLSIYGMYPQGYQHSLPDEELISLFLSSKEKYIFMTFRILSCGTRNYMFYQLTSYKKWGLYDTR